MGDICIIDVDGDGPWLRSDNPRLKHCLFADEFSREMMEEADALAAAGFDESERPPGYYRPQVGDKVRLNDDAVGRFGRLVSSRVEAAELVATHAITEVGDELSPGSWTIELSGAWLGRLLVASTDVVKV